MIFLRIKIITQPGERKNIIDVFNSLKGPIGTTPGCAECSVMVDDQDDSIVCYVEKWQERSALDRHLSSDSFMKILEAMEQSAAKPSVEFFEVNKMGGLDLVEKARMALFSAH